MDRQPIVSVPRRVIIVSLVSSVPFLVIAPMLHGWLFVMVLAIGGFLLQSTLPVNVTFAQLIAPISAATVSSLMMGFAWGTGGLSVPLVGMMADRFGIERALDRNVGLAAGRGLAGGFASVAKTGRTWRRAHRMRPLPKESASMLPIRHQLAQTGV